jgi:ATP-dependent DNA helicase DinG
MVDELEAFFAAGGPLASCLEGYELREGQLQLARAVEGTLRGGGVLLAEAGTGTGKTLAYLVPALLSGKKVVVSTATKTLQAQILDHDVPLLAAATGRPVPVALLKGRENYLCLRRFARFRSRPLFRFAAEAEGYTRLERWAGRTGTGDRAEMPELPDDYGPWRDLCSTSDSCIGGRCDQEADCHFVRQRRAAQRAQVVVVNHHLFFADLAVRSASPGEVLPRHDAVVFDEAQHLEATATQYFGVRVSARRVGELLREAGAALGKEAKGEGGLAAALATVREASDHFWESLPPAEPAVRLREALGGEAARGLGALLEALGRWADRLAPRQGRSQEEETLFRRGEDLRADLGRFALPPEAGEVRWLEGRGRNPSLHSAPVGIGTSLAEAVFSNRAAVLTSATLQVGGDFSYLRSRLAVPQEAEEISVPSPFDHRSRGLLYVPRNLPDPNDPSFSPRAVEEVEALVGASRGRAFCLFTSHRALHTAAEALRGRVGFPLFVQGEAPREVLLRSFREAGNAVLLGAQSFWEGVDVPGEALSLVVIDRVPFASPGEPLVEARIEEARARGESPFRSFQLPAAAMSLRQGVGRLLRRAGDRGVVAILDRRVAERAYGRTLLSSLPPFPMTRERKAVEVFFSQDRGPSS